MSTAVRLPVGGEPVGAEPVGIAPADREAPLEVDGLTVGYGRKPVRWGDRKRDVQGKRVSVRADHCGRRIIKNKNAHKSTTPDRAQRRSHKYRCTTSTNTT